MPVAATTLCLNEFVKLIKGLELTGHICQNHTLNLRSDTIQLPYKVTIAFRKLDNSLNDPSWGGSYATPPQIYFQEFVKMLTTHARANGVTPSLENSHAEYLLGLLLHNHLDISIDEGIYSFEDMMFDAFPLSERDYFQNHTLLEDGYDFLSKTWRANNQYPAATQIINLYENHEQEKAAEEASCKSLASLQEAWTKWQEELEMNRQQQLLDLQNRYYFTHVLNLQEFSYALWAFCQSDKIQLSPQQFYNQTPVLTPSLSTKLARFIHAANYSIFQNEQKEAFVLFLKELIASTKEAHIHQEASHLLLGFLMHHNFHVHDGELGYNMRDIYLLEATSYEKMMLQYNSHMIPCVNTEWLSQQNYPGKETLEQLINNSIAAEAAHVQAATASYLPAFGQCSQQVYQTFAQTQQRSFDNKFGLS